MSRQPRTESSAKLQNSPDPSFKAQLRTCLAACYALEILVNQHFLPYEKKLFTDLVGDRQESSLQKYLGRIMDVMKGKYSLTHSTLRVRS